jgi:hypothetical protein
MTEQPIQDINEGKPWSKMVCGDAPGSDGSVREELAARMKP